MTRPRSLSPWMRERARRTRDRPRLIDAELDARRGDRRRRSTPTPMTPTSIEAEVVDGLPVVVEARELDGRTLERESDRAGRRGCRDRLRRRRGDARADAPLRRPAGRARSRQPARVARLGGRPLASAAGFGPAQTYIVQIRTVTPRPGRAASDRCGASDRGRTGRGRCDPRDPGRGRAALAVPAAARLLDGRAPACCGAACSIGWSTSTASGCTSGSRSSRRAASCSAPVRPSPARGLGDRADADRARRRSRPARVPSSFRP